MTEITSDQIKKAVDAVLDLEAIKNAVYDKNPIKFTSDSCEKNPADLSLQPDEDRPGKKE